MALVIGTVKAQFFNTDGTFCAGGFVYSYEAGGGTTNKNTYPTIADALAGTNANDNPIELDQRGEADIVLQGATRLVLKDSNNVQIWSVDNLNTTTSNVVDSAGGPLLTFVEVANAVNGVTITNATTGNKPTIGFTGGDTNVGGILRTKGTEDINIIASTTNISGAATVGGSINVTGSLTCSAAISFLPAGFCLWWAGTVAPTGWFEADGTAVSRTTYSSLFTNIGTTWGVGDGSTTFNLPTQARRTIVGKGGSGTGTLANSVGSTGGAETVTLGLANLPVGVVSANGGVGTAGYTGGGVSGATGSGWTNSTPAATAVNNIQPSMVMMLCIKAV